METKEISTGIEIGYSSVSSQYWNGDIAEIIVFNRALKTEERQAVEKYLGQKWGIKVAS